MKKIGVLLGAGLLAASLTGCQIDEGSWLYGLILSKSGIEENQDYKDYVDLLEQGELDENSQYIWDKPETEEQLEQGQVCVTFVENSNMELTYYTDAKRTEPVDPGACLLKPGDSIYASEPTFTVAVPELYSFSGFRIYQDNEEGQRQLWLENACQGENLVLQIPDDFDGNRITVEPIGHYRNRNLTLQAYCVDDDGTRNSLEHGMEWYVNDRLCVGGEASVSPVGTYDVQLRYPSEEYYFVAAVPTQLSAHDDWGRVTFPRQEQGESANSFSVELAPYQIVTMSERDVENVWINNIKITPSGGKIEHLKLGDRIEIQTGTGQEPVLTGSSNLEKTREYPNGAGTMYCYELVDKRSAFRFDPQEYVYEHGHIRFTYMGVPIQSETMLFRGRTIEYEVASVDPGYWLPDGDHTIVIGDPDETRVKLHSIGFHQRKKVNVILPQPEVGGNILYSVNGTELTERSCELYEGTEIVMDFQPWAGWICDCSDGIVYTVTGAMQQDVTCEGKNIGQVFKEDSGHKVSMTVDLDESIQTGAQFGILMGENHKEDLTYQENNILEKIGSYSRIFEQENLGTAQGITITARQDAIPGDQAMRIWVEKIDQEGEAASEVRYVTKLPAELHFDIYPPDQLLKQDSYVEEIHVRIDLVERMEYQQLSADRMDIVLTAADTGLPVRDGEIMDKERPVLVRISPQEGCYLLGSGVDDSGVYQKKIAYGKVEKLIRKALEKLTVREVLHVVLDTEDAFGSCRFELDGEPVSGAVTLREDQKLKLIYEVTDDGYQIRRGEGWLANIGSKTKETVKIEIAQLTDGMTVQRNQYIELERKEG